MDRPDPQPDRLTITESAALVGWLMRERGALTTRAVMQATGLSQQNAALLLKRASRVIPIYLDRPEDALPGVPGVWRVCPGRQQ
jgi:hypothetical protein